MDNEKYYLLRLGIEILRASFVKDYNIGEFDNNLKDIKLKYNIDSIEQWKRIKNLKFDYTWK